MTTTSTTLPINDPTIGGDPRRSLMIGAGWTALGTVGSRVILLVGMILAARLLGKSVFGQLGMIQQCVMLFSVVISYGLGLTGAKFLAELQVVDPERAGRVLTFILLSGGLVAVLAGALVAATASAFTATILREPGLAVPLCCGIPWLICSSLSLTMQGCLSGLFAFRATAAVQLAESVLSCALTTAGAVGFGLPGAVLGFGVSAAVGCAAMYWQLRRHCEKSGIMPIWSVRAAWSEGRGLTQFWLPATCAGLVMALANWICPVILVRQPNGFAELAVFNAASYWFNALTMLPNILQRVGTVMQAAAVARRDAVTSAAIHRDSVWLNLLLMGCVIVPLACCSPIILETFGPQFRDGWPAMVVSLVTALVLAVIKPAEQTLNAQGRTGRLLMISIAYSVFFVLTSGWLVLWGATGLATARLAAYGIHAGLIQSSIRFTGPAVPMAAVASPPAQAA